MPRLRTDRKKNPIAVLTAVAAVDRIARAVEKSTVTKKGGKGKVREGKRGHRRDTDITIQSVVAPVASGSLIRGTKIRFGTAPDRGHLSGGLRLYAKQVWAVCAGKSSTALACIEPYAAATSQNTLTFDPNDTKTMPPPLVDMGQVFGRYCLSEATVHFTPAAAGAATGASLGLAMGVCTDAAMNSPATNFGIMEMSNSVAGPVWTPMSLRIPCENTLRYINQTVPDGSLSSAEQRQDHAFIFYAQLDSTPSQSSQTTFGFFHLEYVIDLYEVSNPAAETGLKRLDLRRQVLLQRLSSRHVERKGESPVRDEEKAPISSSLEVAPQERLSGGWSVLHPGWGPGRSLKEPPTPPPSRVQSAKS
jgi:hypothetical protein